jgi:DNA-binding transcriptional ArsR family regulator
MANAETLDLIFHALSDSTRRTILRVLSKKEKTVGQIAKPFEMSLAAVSKHLKVLEAANLIRREKRGSFYHIQLNPEALMSADEWLNYYQQFWDIRLESMKNFLEKENK